ADVRGSVIGDAHRPVGGDVVPGEEVCTAPAAVAICGVGSPTLLIDRAEIHRIDSLTADSCAQLNAKLGGRDTRLDCEHADRQVPEIPIVATAGAARVPCAGTDGASSGHLVGRSGCTTSVVAVIDDNGGRGSAQEHRS